MGKTLLGLLILSTLAWGQQNEVDSVIKQFNQAKPTTAELRFYSLDWVCSLAEAKTRAKKENRPILVILNTNISAHCNLYSGHT